MKIRNAFIVKRDPYLSCGAPGINLDSFNREIKAARKI